MGAKTTRNILDQNQLTGREREKKSLAERDTCSARSHEVVADYGRMLRVCEEEKNKAGNMLTKVQGLYELTLLMIVDLRAVTVSGL